MRQHDDYCEEAIPERDPAYRLPTGTLADDQTVADMPVETRRELALALIALGMNPARAHAIAAL